MKKILLPILIGIFFLSCESGININLSCVLKHTTQVVKFESPWIGSKTKTLVNLTWTWIKMPPGDSVIVERSTDSLNWTYLGPAGPIVQEMYYNDTDTLLIPGDTIWYNLGYVSAGEITYFITPKLVLPQAHHFYEPAADTIGNDTLNISFMKLIGFDTYILSLYKANVTDPDSLMNLPSALWCDTITDTTVVLPIPDGAFPDTAVYTIKVDATKTVQLLQDGSYGFRPFFKKP